MLSRKLSKILESSFCNIIFEIGLVISAIIFTNKRINKQPFLLYNIKTGAKLYKDCHYYSNVYKYWDNLGVS